METSDKIINTIFKAVDEVNKKLPQERRLERSIDAAWLGPSSKLDSLGLVFLIVAVEKNIKEDFGVAIRIVGEKIASLNNSPLRSAGSLARHIQSLLEGKI